MTTNGTELAAKMALFERDCAEKGVRLTSQRLEVFRVLAAASDHPTVETIHRRVLKRLPRTSLDTVYRTLSHFEESQVITRVGGISGSARFESNMAPHHHFICSDCGFILDLPTKKMTEVKVANDLPEGFEVDSVQVELRGRCAKCRRGAGKK